MSTTALPSHPSDDRTRYVHQRWNRDEDGPLLTKPGPQGVRTPNGLIWGHDLNDFFWIQRIPKISLLTIWSRSMIKEYGENYDEHMFAYPDSRQVPRVRHAWPVLKLPRNLGPHDLKKDLNARYGIIDPGCDAILKGNWVPTRRDDTGEACSDAAISDHEMVATLFNSLLISAHPDRELENIFVLNDPHYPIRSPEGLAYTLLWSPRMKEILSIAQEADPTFHVPDPASLFAVDGASGLLQLDDVGMKILAPEGADTVNMLGRFLATPDDDDAPADQSREDTVVDNASTTSAEPFQIESPPSPNDLDRLSPATPIPKDSPFSVEDLPKLEESLPKEYMPDVLYVHDPHRVTIAEKEAYDEVETKKYKARKPLLYRRVWPEIDRNIDPKLEPDTPSEPPRVAHIHLAHQNRFGVGNHSLVHRVALTLPAPLSAHSRNGRVTVAAKSAFPVYTARTLLKNEGKIYNSFPEHLTQDWCGYNLVTPIKHPVPVGPVAPKFYGYYVPEGRGEMDEDAPSPILLMEECGEPVEPRTFNADARYA